MVEPPSRGPVLIAAVASLSLGHAFGEAEQLEGHPGTFAVEPMFARSPPGVGARYARSALAYGRAEPHNTNGSDAPASVLIEEVMMLTTC